MNYSYSDYVVKYSDNFKRLFIDPKYVEQISAFAKKVVDRKLLEEHHKIDKNNEIKRFTTGLLGEAALEKLFGIKIIDWRIGKSSCFNKPDIPGFSVGIKTVEKWKFPVIFKENKYPQIICIKSDRVENLIFVCGLAMPNILNHYQDDDLILSPSLRKRGIKTGFYGFEHLVKVSSIGDIQMFKTNSNK